MHIKIRYYSKDMDERKSFKGESHIKDYDVFHEDWNGRVGWEVCTFFVKGSLAEMFC